MFQKISNSLSGRKTYIVAVVAAVFNLLVALNVVQLTPDQLLAVNGVLVALGGAAIRSGINNQ